MSLAFTKMHALGNDFIVVNNLDNTITLSKACIKKLSDRHTGIGFDQLLMLETTSVAGCDFHYRIFNGDGSEVGQCGNGARCVAKFIADQKLSRKKQIKLSTHTTTIELHIDDDTMISVNMNQPIVAPEKIPLLAQQQALYSIDINQEKISFSALGMGNPHAVIVVKDYHDIDINNIGTILNQHPLFPEGVNVGFMNIIDKNTIQLRVYERGAGETLACGSGACAAVVAGIQQGVLNSKVNVRLTGGKLDISWQGADSPVWMTGPAEYVFDGSIN